jgi:hypothetical protein
MMLFWMSSTVKLGTMLLICKVASEAVAMMSVSNLDSQYARIVPSRPENVQAHLRLRDR